MASRPHALPATWTNGAAKWPAASSPFHGASRAPNSALERI